MRTMCSCLRWVVPVMAACGLALPAFAQSGGTAASAPATMPAAVERAMKYAPQKSAGVIHVEVKTMVKDVLAGFAKDPEFKSLDANAIAALVSMAEKIESMDVFIPDSGNEPTPPLFVIRGGLTPADVNRNPVIRAMMGGSEDLLEKKEDANGRYEVFLGGNQAVLEYVLGGEAPELPAGISLIGPGKMLTKESLPKLGGGPNKELRNLLAGVDSAAPIWFAVLGDRLSKETDIPKTAVGGVYLLGGGLSRAVLEFQDANAAEAGINEVTKARDEEEFLPRLFLSVMESNRQGAVVTYTSKTKESMVPQIVSVLAESRKAAKKTASQAFLRMMGGRMVEWSADHDDKLPANLLELVRDEAIPAQMLVSPVTGRVVKTDANGMPQGAFEPDYVLVNYPTAMLKIKESNKKVLVYERPEIYKNEGTNVLHVDGHVEWVKMEDFTKLLKATQEWIAAQEKK